KPENQITQENRQSFISSQQPGSKPTEVHIAIFHFSTSIYLGSLLSQRSKKKMRTLLVSKTVTKKCLALYVVALSVCGSAAENHDKGQHFNEEAAIDTDMSSSLSSSHFEEPPVVVPDHEQRGKQK
ncbi:unnamed protein product, partial [Amoebophrya sp. A120]